VIVGYDKLEISFMLFSIVSGLVLCLLAHSQRVWLHGAVLAILILSVIGYFFTEVAAQDLRWKGFVGSAL
jgi:membrane protein YdbS with pleckstrin-like domain